MVTCITLLHETDIEQGTVSKLMSGGRSITLDHAKRLARRFKMRPEAFLDLD
jgi:antitoxin component HigA of HigAB toxin-antitoxin module